MYIVYNYITMITRQFFNEDEMILMKDPCFWDVGFEPINVKYFIVFPKILQTKLEDQNLLEFTFTLGFS